jgi:hypothetical protein
MPIRARVTAVPMAVVTACLATSALAQPRRDEPPGFLYVWATVVDTIRAPNTPAGRRAGQADILATIDLRETSPTRGQVVRVTVVADTAARMAHHTEHALAADGLFFANDFGAGRTYRFDLNAPGEPQLLGAFTAAGPFGYPHSFVRLPNGNVLATYQGDVAGRPPGGLVELRRDGSLVRSARAATPGVDSTAIQPYSLEVLPALDRVVTTSTSMMADVGVHVQIWRLSDLALLRTLAVPPAPASHADHAAHAAMRTAAHDTSPDVHHLFPGEPRVLADGRTVMLGTFTCGLYRLTDIASATPRLDYVSAFPGENCAVPARVGRWWVQTVPALHALVALDVGDPARPREVSRLAFDSAVTPHGLATDASGERLVMDAGSPADPRVHLVRLDRATGALRPDPTTPTIDLSRLAIPGLGVRLAVPHGAVFGPVPTR